MHLLKSIDLRRSCLKGACSSTGLTLIFGHIIRSWDKGGLLTGSRGVQKVFIRRHCVSRCDSLLLEQKRPFSPWHLGSRLVSGLPGHWPDRPEERWRQHHRLTTCQQFRPHRQPCRPAVDGVWQQRHQNAQEQPQSTALLLSACLHCL